MTTIKPGDRVRVLAGPPPGPLSCKGREATITQVIDTADGVRLRMRVDGMLGEPYGDPSDVEVIDQ